MTTPHFIHQVPSDKIQFNQKPEMKASEITAVGIEALKSGKYKMVRINYANPDMVGHTGQTQIIKCSLFKLVGQTDDVKGRWHILTYMQELTLV